MNLDLGDDVNLTWGLSSDLQYSFRSKHLSYIWDVIYKSAEDYIGANLEECLEEHLEDL